MRIFIMILNLIFGGWLLLVNFQPRTMTGMNVIGLLLGALLIVTAVMFYRRQAWAATVLPLVPLILSFYLFFVVLTAEGWEVAFVGGPMIMFGFVFFVFGLLEGWYTWRNRV